MLRNQGRKGQDPGLILFALSQVMVLSKDKDKTRVALSTRKLEPTPGDMLRDPALVYAKADEMAATFRERVAAAEAAAREEEERLATGAAGGAADEE